MLAVVKTPHTEISINGDGAAKILEYLKQKFPVEILTADDDDESCYKICCCSWGSSRKIFSLIASVIFQLFFYNMTMKS